MNERLARIEAGLTDALVQNARLASAVEHLSESVGTLTTNVHELNKAMNQGKGALWIIVGASSVAGGILATAISKFFVSAP